MSNFKRNLKRTLRTGFNSLPSSIRSALLRNLVSVKFAADPRLKIQLAETQEDLEQSFKLLHDSYVSRGFMKPDPSQLRVTPYHALPTTSTIVAKWEGKVIGTVSLIRRTELGLPLEKAFSLDKIIRPGAQIVEVSSLAIDRQFRNEHQILFLLCKYIYEYTLKYMNADFWVIAVNPEDKNLYEDLFLFKRLDQQVLESYDFANGAPAIGLYLDLKHVPNSLGEVYFNAPPNKNLFAFFVAITFPLNFIFPTRRISKSFDSVMTPKMLEYFFTKKTSVFNRLTPPELMAIRQCYLSSPNHLRVIPRLLVPQNGYRQLPRFKVNCESFGLETDTKKVFELNVLEVSENGFSATTENAIHGSLFVGRNIDLQIATSSFELSTIRAEVAWIADKHGVGFRVVLVDEKWKSFIKLLKEDVSKGAVGSHLRAVKDEEKIA